MFHRSVVSVLDFKAVFDSVDRAAVWRYLSLKCAPDRFISLMQSVYANKRTGGSAYNDVSPEFIIRNGFRQGCPLSSYFTNVFIEVLMKSTHLQLRKMALILAIVVNRLM